MLLDCFAELKRRGELQLALDPTHSVLPTPSNINRNDGSLFSSQCGVGVVVAGSVVVGRSPLPEPEGAVAVSMLAAALVVAAADVVGSTHSSAKLVLTISVSGAS